MTLTLGNDLTGSVAREVSESSRKSSGLGESLTTGTNKFVEVVDGFLGSSLRDNEMILGAIAKNTAYSINMLTITDEYLKTISTALQEGLKTIGSAGPLSADKLAVLQKNLNDKRSQVDLMIKTADFDGKALLAGGAKETDVQVGLSITDKLTLRVNDIGSGKLFRSSVTNVLNEYLAADAARSHYYNGAANAQRFANDKAANTNLIYSSLTAARPDRISNRAAATALVELINNKSSCAEFLETTLPKAKEILSLGGAGNGTTFATANDVAMEQIFVEKTVHDIDPKTNIIAVGVADAVDAQATADATAAAINAANVSQAVKDAAHTAAAVGGFANHNAARVAVRLAAINQDIETAISQAVSPRLLDGAPGVGLPENNPNTVLNNILALNIVPETIKNIARDAAQKVGATGQGVAEEVLLHISPRREVLALLSDNMATNISVSGNAGNASRVLAQDVMQAALNTIRAEQASVSNQKQNVIEAADALRSTTNVTQKAADSYLKTDYVITAQQYSETIRTMVASITALQAANKIPEAAQRLIDALAR